MEELLKRITYLQAYLQAIQQGVDKFTMSAPVLVKQHIQTETRQKLHSTAQHYNEHVSVNMDGSILIVELDKDDWLTNALESGVGAFSLKEMLKTSSKAKTSKAGFKYMRLPLSADKHKKPGTEKGQEFQKRINAVLAKPKVGLSNLKTMMNGKVVESQKVLTDDPQLQGFYRSRLFDNAQEFYANSRKPAWNYVLFRTISENPDSKTGATWEHPGLKPVNIMRSTETWIVQSLPAMLDSFLDAEIKAMEGRIKL